MEKKDNSNQSAFSMPYHRQFVDGEGWNGNHEQYGLTKREYFAAKAMQGELACMDSTYSKKDVVLLLGIKEEEYEWKTHYPLFLAKRAVQYADALLLELSTQQEAKDE